MSQYRLPLLAGAAILIAGLATYGVMQGARDTAVSDAAVRAFPDLGARGQAIGRIEIVGSKSKVTLDQDDKGNWTVREWSGYPAKADSINRLFLDLANLSLVERRSDKPANHEAMGLLAPGTGGSGVEITLVDRTGGLMAGIIQGKTKDLPNGSTIGSLFVRKPGEDQAWYARSNLSAARDPGDWVDKNVVELPADRFYAIDIRPDQKDTVRLARASVEAAELALVNVPAGRAANPSAVSATAASLAQLFADGARPKSAVDMTGADLVRYTGLAGLAIDVRVKRDGAQAYVDIAASVDERRIDALMAALKAAAPMDKSIDPEAQKSNAQTQRNNHVALARREADAINGKTSGWVYSITKAKAQDIAPQLDALLAKPEAAGAKGK
jgi:hypothetical protein